MQKCKFFMEHLRVTQGYGRSLDGKTVDTASYSHNGSYALDLGGKDTGQDWAYAPCDIEVKRIYGTYNAVWFETLEEVMCADGLARKLVFMLLHINNSDRDALGIKVGKIFRQGEKFYREGSAGAIGNHIHLEVGLAPFTPTGWVQTNVKDRTGAYVWKINNQLKPHEIFILGKDVQIMHDGGYSWTVESTIKGAAKLKIGWASSGDLNTLVNMIVAIGGINADVKDGYIYTSEISKGDREAIMQTCAELGVPCVPYEEAEETETTYLVGPMSGGDQDTLIATCQELGVHYEIVGDLNEVIPAPEENAPEQPQTDKNIEEIEEIPVVDKEPLKEENIEIEPNTGSGDKDINVPDKPATDTDVGTNEPDVPDTNVGDKEPAEDFSDKNPKKNLFTKLLDAIVAFFKVLLG